MKSGYVALVCVAVTLLAGCANRTERHQELALSGLQHALSGSYHSSSPATDTPVRLTISPVTAQLIGDAVYYVRETPADNNGLVLWQGVWSLTVLVGGKHDEVRIVQHNFLFKDPRRWAAAATNPDLLESMLPTDLQALPGCDLVWRATEHGYETLDSSNSCQPGTRASGLWVEQQATLDGTGLSLTQRLVDDSGTLDRGAPQLLHLARAGAAP